MSVLISRSVQSTTVSCFLSYANTRQIQIHEKGENRSWLWLHIDIKSAINLEKIVAEAANYELTISTLLTRYLYVLTIWLELNLIALCTSHGAKNVRSIEE